MISIANNQDMEALIARINKLDESSTPLWGKMSVYQMLRHCAMWQEMALGKKAYKQSFMGRLFGKIALKDMMKYESMKPNLPTVPSFVIKEEGNSESEKAKLIALIEEHSQCLNNGFVHPFFGKLSLEQGTFMASKHLDHHLRQFGV